MRRLVWITTAVAALVCAAVAVAHDFDSKSVKSVSATFTATAVSDLSTATCSATDGTYVTTKATYTGTATSSEPTLNGPITFRAESLVNMTTGFGKVSGSFRIDTSGGGHTSAGFAATATGANISGLAAGRAQDAELLGNLSSGFSSSGGFTSGKLGGGTSGGDAIELLRGGCKPAPPPAPDRIEVHAAITAVSSTSVSAAGVTCAVPANLAASMSNFHVGDQIRMKCTSSGGTTTLVEIAKDGEHGHGFSHVEHSSKHHH